MKSDNLFQHVKEEINKDNTILAERILKSKKHSPELKHKICRVLIDLAIENNKLEYFDIAIEGLEKIKNFDLDNVNFNLGSAYLEKYNALGEKPNYLIDDEKLLFNSKREFKKEVAKHPDKVLRETNINLGIIYNKIGRPLEALDYFEKVLEKHETSAYALYNKGNTLLAHSSFIDSPILVKEAYQNFKFLLTVDKLPNNMKENCENFIDFILEDYPEEFLESDDNQTYEIPTESEFESFMIDFCLENKLFLNPCNYCQSCQNAVGDKIVIRKMISEVEKDINDDLFLNLSSYLNQLKMDFISARFLFILSQFEDFNLEIIMKHVLIIDAAFSEENDIRVQILKDSFKNFFNILDKISVFIKRYLELDIPMSKVNFRNVWFEYDKKKKKVIDNKINPKLLLFKKNNGLTALYDIYLDVEYNNEKEYLRRTRNNLTHKYLRVTDNKINDDDKTLDELKKETIEIAILAKNAIIYLIRLVEIHEEDKWKDLDVNFIPVEGIKDIYKHDD